MDINPYKPPFAPPPKAPDQQFRFALDLFALIFALAPCLVVVGYRVLDNASILQMFGQINDWCYVLWSVSLALHVWGISENRRISIIGLFCNFAAFVVTVWHFFN